MSNEVTIKINLENESRARTIAALTDFVERASSEGATIYEVFMLPAVAETLSKMTKNEK